MAEAPLPRFMSVDDVAEELAVSRAVVYSTLKSGVLPAIQVGPKNIWRIERRVFEEYIEARYAETRERRERGEI
ncbi:helix-turn-helix domain-containing protein [Isoptericola sp. NPDC056578]|uniref:helix-turn-helix domain-containing protein n=1 Tax=unclassified Isoptericola TaxID=2623355 RepID=UPI0036C14D23